ncbi:MAG: hypothetical protein ACREX7_06805 [Casimicrobiaceae bacterium]
MALFIWLSACATPPEVSPPAPLPQAPSAQPPAVAPLQPPTRIEAAPAIDQPPRIPAPTAPAEAPAAALPTPAPIVIVQEAPPAAPPINEDEQQTLTLLADLQRYAGAPPDELRRELAAANQINNRARSDANRIRLAVLLTTPAAGPPDDGRALALLESVSGKTGGTSPLKQLALVLYAQVAERMRNVSEEKKRSALAQEKLDQLRAVERSLLLERSRNAGGAGGGGGGGTGR